MKTFNFLIKFNKQNNENFNIVFKKQTEINNLLTLINDKITLIQQELNKKPVVKEMEIDYNNKVNMDSCLINQIDIEKQVEIDKLKKENKKLKKQLKNL